MAGEAFGLGGGKQTYDAKFAVAFPEDFDGLPEGDRAVYQSTTMTILADGGPALQRYKGAVVMPCSMCRTPLHVGPRLQRQLAADSSITLICPLCYVKSYGEVDTDVHELGNTGEESRTFEVLGIDDQFAQELIEKQVKPQRAAAALRKEGLDVDVAFVNTAPDAKGFVVKCSECGRTARMPTDPGTKVGVCPSCVRRRLRY